MLPGLDGIEVCRRLRAASDVPGEQAWPTQPFPVKPPPLVRQSMTPEDLTDVTPDTVLIGGHVVMQGRQLKTIDLAAAMAAVSRIAEATCYGKRCREKATHYPAQIRPHQQ